jgi:CheY-like chemotaxis protein
MEHLQVSKHIWLVDDDRVTNFVNERLLVKEGVLTVMAFTKASEALEQLSKLISSAPDHLPEVIFLDINMPIMDGWEFLDEFQSLDSDALKQCRVYMLTSSIDQEDQQKSSSYKSVCGFISKPLTPEKIRHSIGERL